VIAVTQARSDGLERAAKRLPRQLQQRALHADQGLTALWSQLIPADAPAVMLAIGGYGRQQLFPSSDVDVAIVHADDIDDFSRLRLEAFAAAAWSLELDLALTTRSLSALAEDLEQQQELCTSLLFARVLAGAAPLFVQIQQYSSECSWTAQRFLDAKLTEQRTRHARFADTAYNLEPHLKDGPGGLRDIQTIRWVYARASGLLSLNALVRKGLLEANELSTLEGCERTLGAIRRALHEAAGRREERLLFDHQLTLAQGFGFTDEGYGRRGVEALMQRYYRCASEVSQLNGRLLERLRSALQAPRAPIILDSDWQLSGDLLETRHAARLAEDPQLLLDGLHRLAKRPDWRGFGPLTARKLHEWVAGYPEHRLPQIALALIDALKQPIGAARLLRLASDCGLLGRLLPAWEQVRGRMQFDLFHTYTVDEHTLRLLQGLEESTQDDNTDFTLPQVVWMRVRRPELLFLAGLFHDIAKGRGGDHSELGADDARQWLRALGLEPEATEVVAWLVAEHLRMSVTAQKKDISDPAVVADFATRVRDPERLNLLFLLTLADIKATNPKLWNGWKARLIGDLYEATRYQLRRGAAQRIPDAERIAHNREAAFELLRGEGAGVRQIETIWADFRPESFLRLKPDELRWITHAILAHGNRNEPLVAARRSAGLEGYQVFVRAADQPGLFATLTAVLDGSQLSVLGARITSGFSGLSLDTFEVLDLSGTSDAVARSMEIQLKLKLALAQQPLKPKLVRRLGNRQQKHFRIPIQIEFDQVGAGQRTQVAVVCRDRPGLLARVALVFHEFGLRVHAARIATFGERVEDFFEVSNAADLALDATLCDRVRLRLHERLSDQA
jgi:[protein-PII] uridylyltransferase